MDIFNPVFDEIERVTFHLLTADQIRQLSVCQVTQSVAFDSLNHPVKNGLYDPLMGPIERVDKCITCHQSSSNCNGHFGHIELAVPVYNPVIFGQLFITLRLICFNCFKFSSRSIKNALVISKLKLLNAGLLKESMDIESLSESRTDPNEQVALINKLTRELLIKKGNNFNDQDDNFQTHTPVNARTLDGFNVANSNPNGDNNKKKTSIQRQVSISNQKAKIIKEFFSRESKSSICPHCSATIPLLYQSKNMKIFQQIRLKSAPITAKIFQNEEFEKNLKRKKYSFDNDDENDKSNDDENDNKSNDKKDKELKIKNPIPTTGMRYLTPVHIFDLLRKTWDHEKLLTFLLFEGQDFRVFFCEAISVPPSRFRPPSLVNNSQCESAQNGILSEIIKLSSNVAELGSSAPLELKQDQDNLTQPIERSRFNKMIDAWVNLQAQVNNFIDSSGSSNGFKNSSKTLVGIRQILEKKEGIFRKHMMGKRVNYAARSVISPDPNLETCEIGVPMVFAKKLVYPEPITNANVEILKAAVRNGSKIHPGATHIQMENNAVLSLDYFSNDRRLKFANSLCVGGRIRRVFRHIQDGDMVLMNRQPTLHKPSIMAHRVKVLSEEKTIRMHYANCNTYNADFDGDEMNLHFPQNELARSEAQEVVFTDHQYLVPTDGGPLRGLIQDHVVTGVILTMKDTFLTRETFQQLLWGSLPYDQIEEEDSSHANHAINANNSKENGIDHEQKTSSRIREKRIETPPPAILKPKELWTGKQLITTVLMNLLPSKIKINLSSPCKISSKLWGKDHEEEAKVIVLNSHLVTGVLDKSQIGASSYGLTHAIFELAGAKAAGQFLTTMSRILTKYDQHYGFTCRLDDLLIRKDSDEQRKSTIWNNRNSGLFATAEYAKVPNPLENKISFQESLELIIRDAEKSKELDGVIKTKMNKLTSTLIETCLPDGQQKLFPKNNLSLMTQSGAKGSMVNFSQISCCLGQQELEGRRVPVMVSGKTLPSFRAWDGRARAGGYVSQRFVTGIRPQEFFFHCMAGREGLIDTTVKTSRSGYLQRCLVKHLEGLSVHYDNTVRGDDGSIFQFYYGEDGLDITKQKYLKNFSFQFENFEAVRNNCRLEATLPMINCKDALKNARKSWKKPQKYDPVNVLFNPSTHLGSTSESFYNELEEFIQSSNNQIEELARKSNKTEIKERKDAEMNEIEIEKLKEKNDQFRILMWLKYMKSLVEPGEAVGVLAAQSIGEPSTQMTLNTFHFAGFGAKNVTLGIPRLREIIMTASKKIKTPSMILTLKDSSYLPILLKKLSNISFEKILGNVTVSESFVSVSHKGKSDSKNRRVCVYNIKIQLVPFERIDEFIDRNKIKEIFENQFTVTLVNAIVKQIRQKINTDKLLIVSYKEQKMREGSNADEEDGNEMENEEGESKDHKDGNENHSSSHRSKNKRNKEADENEDEDEFDYKEEGNGEEEGVRSSRKKEYDTYDADEEENDNNHQDEMQDEFDIEKNEIKSDSEKEEEKEFLPSINRGIENLNIKNKMETDSESSSETDNFDCYVLNENENEKNSSHSNEIDSPSSSNPKSFIHQCDYIQNYKFDSESSLINFEMILPAESPKILLLDLIQRISKNVLINHIPGIQRCFPSSSKKKVSQDKKSSSNGNKEENSMVSQIITEGVNVTDLWPFYEMIDFSSIQSNDIYAILLNFGVEAARATIVREIASVFTVYGISVNQRHLYLIADYMTHTGSYRPFSRFGMDDATASPLLKMTFESTVSFVRKAALAAESDDCNNPAGRLVIGKPVSLGTGASRLQYKMSNF